jgi:hypothetical protein
MLLSPSLQVWVLSHNSRGREQYFTIHCPQGLAAHTHTLVRQMLGGQRRAEPGIARLTQGAPRDRLGNLAVRAAAAQSMQDSLISLSVQPGLQTTALAVGQPQSPRRFPLLQMTFLHLLQPSTAPALARSS